MGDVARPQDLHVGRHVLVSSHTCQSTPIYRTIANTPQLLRMPIWRYRRIWRYHHQGFRLRKSSRPLITSPIRHELSCLPALVWLLCHLDADPDWCPRHFDPLDVYLDDQ